MSATFTTIAAGNYLAYDQVPRGSVARPLRRLDAPIEAAATSPHCPRAALLRQPLDACRWNFLEKSK